MNLVEIGSVIFKVWEVEIGKILVHINNTLVLRATFLAARHTTVCLNIVYCIQFCTVGTKLVAGMEQSRGPTPCNKGN